MHTDKSKVALDRVMKARAELIFTRTFYGVLVGQVAPQMSDKFPTAATNGRVHFFNPDFINSLPQDEVLGTQAHESEHDARRHGTRRGGRDPKKWNQACDWAINIDLVDQGFKLPKGALIDPRFRGFSAEEIYRIRELEEAEEQKRKEQEQAEDESEPDEGEGEPSDNSEGEDHGDETEVDEEESVETGDDQDEGDDGEDASGGDEADGEEDGKEAEGDGGNGEDAETDEAGSEGEGSGEADGEPEGEGAGEGSSEAEGEASGDANAEGEPGEGEPVSCGDPGRCGEVLDSAETAAEMAEEDARWETTLRQAAMLAAKRGECPGHVAREIERADNPPKDWKEELRAWYDHGATSSETWSKPNRRFIGSGLYMPGRIRDGINKIVFLIDTSGSMDAIALACIATETQAAMDEGIIDTAIAVYGDTRVTNVQEFRHGDDVNFDPKGGGGTVLRPLFDYVRDNIDDATLCVVFTDGFIDNVAVDEPPCQVLWAYTGYPQDVKQHMANTPWGAPAIDVGLH